jgi:ubiE/COQ5 methyltransferase family
MCETGFGGSVSRLTARRSIHVPRVQPSQQRNHAKVRFAFLFRSKCQLIKLFFLNSRIYDQYSFQIIPPMGQLLAGQWQPYQYLVESIRKFPKQVQFKEMIEAAGFKFVTFENLTFGVCSIHSGFKI